VSDRAETIAVIASPPPGGDGVLEPLRHAPDPTWIAAPAGYRIPVRRYGEDGPLRPVVLLHGLQSHSGWFVQSARRLAEGGAPVHAFDRCGSGVSAGGPEIGSRLEGWLAEVDAVTDAALAGGPHDAVYLLGHCFGAIVALLYAALHRPERVAGLILATPALYTRADLPPRDKARVLWSVLRGQAARVSVPLAPEQFSELEPFVGFVRADPLSLRTAPARFMYEVARARRRLPLAVRALRAPLFVAYAGSDVICDNARNRRLLARVTSPAETRTYDGARHILEFSGRRDAFLDALAGWLARRERGSE
jgi:alpha-beta hydrolase superfamily lysophospholipase